ncbi:MAG: hypothetical protein WCB49_13125 [Gammaproteobacteria bacterium]
MDLWETIMLMRLLLELLAAAPPVIEEVQKAVTDFSTHPDTAHKAQAAADGAAAIASTLAAAVAVPAQRKE